MRAIAFALSLTIAAISGVAGAAQPEPQIGYNIIVSDETPEGKVSYVSNSVVVMLDKQPALVDLTNQSGYLVGCSTPCGDRWTETKQLRMKVTPYMHDGIVDTKIEIFGGRSKDSTQPDLQRQVLAATFRSANGDQIVMPLAFLFAQDENTGAAAEGNIKHVIKITPHFERPGI